MFAEVLEDGVITDSASATPQGRRYVGGGQMIDAPYTDAVVRYESI